jgi:Protein of unknown function (DUF2934)
MVLASDFLWIRSNNALERLEVSLKLSACRPILIGITAYLHLQPADKQLQKKEAFMAISKQKEIESSTESFSAAANNLPASQGFRQPTHDEIAVAAYEIYCSRGAMDGGELEDWLEAERQLLARSKPSEKSRSTTA